MKKIFVLVTASLLMWNVQGQSDDALSLAYENMEEVDFKNHCADFTLDEMRSVSSQATPEAKEEWDYFLKKIAEVEKRTSKLSCSKNTSDDYSEPAVSLWDWIERIRPEWGKVVNSERWMDDAILLMYDYIVKSGETARSEWDYFLKGCAEIKPTQRAYIFDEDPSTGLLPVETFVRVSENYEMYARSSARHASMDSYNDAIYNQLEQDQKRAAQDTIHYKPIYRNIPLDGDMAKFAAQILQKEYVYSKEKNKFFGESMGYPCQLEFVQMGNSNQYVGVKISIGQAISNDSLVPFTSDFNPYRYIDKRLKSIYVRSRDEYEDEEHAMMGELFSVETPEWSKILDCFGFSKEGKTRYYDENWQDDGNSLCVILCDSGDRYSFSTSNPSIIRIVLLNLELLSREFEKLQNAEF